MKISEWKISEIFRSTYLATDLPISRYSWKVDINYKTGGKIKSWNIGAQDVPIKELSFSKAENGCLDGKIKLSKLDFPIYYGSEVIIYYNNIRKYRGFISNIPDNIDDGISITPYTKRFDEISINTTYTNYTFQQMIQDFIPNFSTETNIFYNESLINFSDTTIYGSVKYNYEKIKKVIEDYYEKEDDAYWGVDENGFFYIKKRDDNVSAILYSGQDQAFQKFKYKKDYSKLKYTRINIFQKSTGGSGENVFIATIPDGSYEYPYILNETETQRKDEKKTAPEGFSIQECKDWAWAELNNQKVPENIKITGVDIRKFDFNIGQKIRLWTGLELRLVDLISCDTLTNWTNGSLENEHVEGDYSIRLRSSYAVYYDFGEIKNYHKIEKISFMINSNDISLPVKVNAAQDGSRYSLDYYSSGIYSYSSGGSNEYEFYIPNVNVWNLVEVPIGNNFRYLGFFCQSTYVLIDDIRLYGYQKKYYEGNIISCDYKINKKNQYLYDVEIGDYDKFSNDLLFAMQKKIAVLEASQQSST